MIVSADAPCRQAKKIDNGYTVAVGAGLDVPILALWTMVPTYGWKLEL